MLEMAIADFYNAQQAGVVTIRVTGDDYYIVGDTLIGEGIPYNKLTIELAAIATCFDVEYITE